MFTQVYFHKTRVAYDIHLRLALKEILPSHMFTKPFGEGLEEYLNWDDWRVLGALANGEGGEHGDYLRTRCHYRLAHATKEICTEEELDLLDRVKGQLGSLVVAEESATKNWYKKGATDIPVIASTGRVEPLSSYSSVVGSMKGNNQILIYVRPGDAVRARAVVKKVVKNP